MRRRRGPARADRQPARPHIGQSQAANWHSSHSDADQILLPASSNPAEQSGGNARVLVMRRRAGESFLIGEAIEIEVLEVCGTRVKLGIVAPDCVPIQRKETQITRDENITAAHSVRQQNISSLLNKVVFQPAGAGVKNLTDAPALTTKGT